MQSFTNTRTTSEFFKEKFIKKLPHSRQWQRGDFQIYTLLSDYLVLPTPLFLTDYNCFFYLEEGVFNLQIGHEKLTIKAPAVIFICSGSIISFESVTKKLQGYFILIEDSIMTTQYNDETALNLFTIKPSVSLLDNDNIWIKNLCELLYLEIDKPYLSNPIAHGLLQALLFKILKISESGKTISRTEEIAINFQKLVHSNFKENKKVPYYAQLLSISENHLNSCIKSVFGKSAKELIIQIAILNSRMLMWNTTKTIVEICYELNFEDPSYLTRIFKKVTGVTPTQYRNQISHDLS